MSGKKVTPMKRVIEGLLEGQHPYEFVTEEPGYYMTNKGKVDDFHDLVSTLRQNELMMKRMKKAALRPWQQEIFDRLVKQETRKVLWVYDEKGNTGKSFLADYICSKMEAFIWEQGDKTDFAYAYKNEKVVIFDFGRDVADKIDYSIFESLKNGRIASGKYQSKMKRFRVAKVIVFANFAPKLDKLSMDRWDIYDINQPLTPEDGEEEDPGQEVLE